MDTLASRSRRLDPDSESETNETCGPTSLMLFAYWDHGSSCWRTSQLTLDLDLTPSSVTLPKQGSMRNGRLYQRPMSARAIEENDSLLLPTPAADDSGNSPENHLRKKPGRKVVTSLRVMARGGLLPTPQARDGGAGPDYAREGRPDSGTDDLVTMIAKLLPTPTSRDGKGRNQRNDKRCLTGAITRLQSDDTNDSSDDLRLFPLMTVDG